MADRSERKTRGLTAIAITDGIHGLGLRPVSARWEWELDDPFEAVERE